MTAPIDLDAIEEMAFHCDTDRELLRGAAFDVVKECRRLRAENESLRIGRLYAERNTAIAERDAARSERYLDTERHRMFKAWFEADAIANLAMKFGLAECEKLRAELAESDKVARYRGGVRLDLFRRAEVQCEEAQAECEKLRARVRELEANACDLEMTPTGGVQWRSRK